MAGAVLRISNLPANPLDAAAHFHAATVPDIRRDFATRDIRLSLAVVFEPASHEHRGWRLAAIQALAREMAPGRVNAVVGSEPDSIDETIAFLESAPGVTGQLLEVDAIAGEAR